MSNRLKVVAIVTANPALGRLLEGVLAARPQLRVRRFESAKALYAYARIAPVDLLVCDYFLPDTTAEHMASELGHFMQAQSRPFGVVALAEHVSFDMQARCRECGIDEVLVKPMSPLHLEERVFARLRSLSQQESRHRVPAAEPTFFGHGNVVELAAYKAVRSARSRAARNY